MVLKYATLINTELIDSHAELKSKLFNSFI